MMLRFIHKSHPGSQLREANVAEWIQERQRLEVQLAWELLEIFNKSLLIVPLRRMAEFAHDEMMTACRENSGRVAVDEAIKDEQRVKMRILMEANLGAALEEFKVKTYQDLYKIKPDQMDAQDCSDLIRLYGTYVEKTRDAEMNRLKSQYRKEIDGQNAIWNQDPAKFPFGRHRYNVYRGDQKAEYQRAVAKWGVDAVQDFLISQKGGQAGFALADSSTIHRIDRVLGLVPAADISGTTTDTIFFIAKFGRMLYTFFKDKIYYMLPLATIVAGAHHSMLEVAASLSLNRDVTGIDYSVGFYTTLLPQERGDEFRTAVRNIQSALSKAEKSLANRHMLVWYDRGYEPGGCYLADPNDPTYKNFAKVTNLLRVFRQMPANPGESQISYLCMTNGLQIANPRAEIARLSAHLGVPAS